MKGLIADFLGNPRPVDDGNGTAEFDMGAFEFQPSQALTSVRERHQPMP